MTTTCKIVPIRRMLFTPNTLSPLRVERSSPSAIEERQKTPARQPDNKARRWWQWCVKKRHI